MHHGSRTICLLMALLAVVTELVSAAFSPDAHDAAKPAALAGAAVNEAPAPVIAESSAPDIAKKVVTSQNFSTSPLEMRIVAYAPQLRVIASTEASSRQMASLADAHERQLQFVKITLG